MSSTQRPQGHCLLATLRRPPVTNNSLTFFNTLEKLWYDIVYLFLYIYIAHHTFHEFLIALSFLLKDIDIKKVNGVPQYAFVQYFDIASVCKAIKKMDGEYLGSNRLKVHQTVVTFLVCLGYSNVFSEYKNLFFSPLSLGLERVCPQHVFGWMAWHPISQSNTSPDISVVMDMLLRYSVIFFSCNFMLF